MSVSLLYKNSGVNTKLIHGLLLRGDHKPLLLVVETV